MPWYAFILVGGAVNAFTNLGYKLLSGRSTPILVIAITHGVCALVLLAYALLYKQERLTDLATGNIPLILCAMGIGAALTSFFFINAMKTGPYTLVDPMWACIYALTSVTIGLAMLREAPSPWALGGIACYLVGAFLMANK